MTYQRWRSDARDNASPRPQRIREIDFPRGHRKKSLVGHLSDDLDQGIENESALSGNPTYHHSGAMERLITIL